MKPQSLKGGVVGLNRLATLTTFYVTALIISEVMATKVVHVAWYVGPAGVIMYPFSFMLADVLTELYGGQVARKVVWTGLVALFVLVAWTVVGTLLPSVGGSSNDAMAHAYNMLFGFVPRIVSASVIAYLVGETLNVTVMAWLRQRRWFGARTIFSTAVGQLFDSGIFIVIAFYGTVPNPVLIRMMYTQYIAKVLIEALLGTPMAYAAVRWVRQADARIRTRQAS